MHEDKDNVEYDVSREIVYSYAISKYSTDEEKALIRKNMIDELDTEEPWWMEARERFNRFRADKNINKNPWWVNEKEAQEFASYAEKRRAGEQTKEPLFFNL